VLQTADSFAASDDAPEKACELAPLPELLVERSAPSGRTKDHPAPGAVGSAGSEATAESPATAEDFVQGDEVFVVGLLSQPQHNGERGRVVGRQGNRLKVVLSTGTGMAIRPQNLTSSRGRSSRARA
jgi:hypothetical protein